jgi:hypothetical protein
MIRKLDTIASNRQPQATLCLPPATTIAMVKGCSYGSGKNGWTISEADGKGQGIGTL